ncbi:tyrosine-type recombinase/integrase [Enterococcus faecium]|uniref:tyrosine-type recombinase/integrase n=1 Tax=Enterococcus faecium TaxID=1352 RepID=UPI000F4E40DE|nr:tyrosine-type recombinase/integrase [Enterococcus faecium]ROY94350.1 recombinase [Enterococcus faecium]ROY95495.1 recombinase [Enterococcus faecium]
MLHGLLSFTQLYGLYPERKTPTLCFAFSARTRQAGIPLEDIKDFLGHKDVSTTQVYAHISPEVKKRSMNQLENYIEEQIKKHSN